MQENRRVYEVIRFEDVEAKKGHCGIVKRLYENDISLDFVEIKDGKVDVSLVSKKLGFNVSRYFDDALRNIPTYEDAKKFYDI